MTGFTTYLRGLIGVIVFRTCLAQWLSFFVLVFSAIALNAVRYAAKILVVTNGAKLARFDARSVLKLTGVTFGTIGQNVTTSRFVTGRTRFAILRIWGIGVRNV